jgi:hypothetical protein
MSLLPLSDGTLSLALAAAAPLVFWAWAMAGWRRLAHGRAGHVYRSRNAAVTVALLPLTVGAVFAWVFATGALHVPDVLARVFVGAVAGMGLMTHLAAAPGGSAVLKRLRGLTPRLGFAAAVTAAGAGLALVLPRPELTVVLAAAAIFHRHHRAGAALLVQTHMDVEGLTARLLAFQAAERSAAVLGAAGAGPARLDPVDKPRAAG